MRNLVVMCAFLLTSVIALAQTGAELKNAGNAAITKKDYATAAKNYEAYLASGEEGAKTDSKTIFNLATCYDKLGKDVEAVKNYKKCIANKYRGDMASYKIAGYKKEAGNVDGYIEDMKQILVDYPKSRYKKTFIKIITSHYNKMAQVPYNEGNKLATAAATSGDGNVYLSSMKKAVVKFEEAKLAFAKTLEVEADNKDALGAIATIGEQIKSYENYKAQHAAAQK